ncbi:hypothetical protein [Chryseobacterium wanjuense]
MEYVDINSISELHDFFDMKNHYTRWSRLLIWLKSKEATEILMLFTG